MIWNSHQGDRRAGAAGVDNSRIALLSSHLFRLPLGLVPFPCDRLPVLLQPSAIPFGVQPPLPCGAARAGSDAVPGRFGGAPHEFKQPLRSIPPVLDLTSKAAGPDDENALRCHPLSGQAHQSPSNRFRQAGCVLDIEPQLHGRVDLVDVLASRSRRPDKFEFQLVPGDGYYGCCLQHGVLPSRLRPIYLKRLLPGHKDRFFTCEADLFQNPPLRDSGKIDTFSAYPASLR